MNITFNIDNNFAKTYYPYFDGESKLPKEILEKIDLDKEYFKEKYQAKRYFTTNGEATIIHLGKVDTLTLEMVRRFGSIAVSSAKKNYDKDFNLSLDYTFFEKSNNPLKLEEIIYAAVEGLDLTNYSYDKFKTQSDKKFKIESVNILSDKNIDFEKIVNKFGILKESIYLTRDLVNAPANVVNIDYIQNEAKRIANSNKLTINIKNKDDLLKEGFNLLYNVGKAGIEPPRLIEINYNAGKEYPKICLVGKGIVFDTGGLNLKPENYMLDMKSDMAGAATALSLINCISELKLNVNVTSLLPLAENAIDANSYRPGDVIIGYNKKSVEILNTDAEGRLILADALAYADTKNFDLIIDFATLTGAVVIALGSKIAGVFFKNDKYKKEIFDSSQKMGEPIWELPLFEEYKENLKGDIADIANLGTPQRQAGSTMGALFLSEFVTNPNWIHFDIAGTSHLDKKWFYNPKGGSGFIIRTIVDFLEKLSK